MHVLGILNQNVTFGYFQARTQNETWAEWAMNGWPPGEGRKNAHRGKGVQPSLLQRPAGNQPQRDRVSLCQNQKSPPRLAMLQSSTSFKIEFPTKKLWVPRNVSPATSTQVSEPWVRGHEATGKTWEEKPWSSDSRSPSLQHQNRQSQLIPSGLQMVADKQQRLACQCRDLTLREKLETTYL